MKKSLLIIVLILFVVSSNAQNIWMNEIHYDNVGTDEGEFIEIVLENAGTYNLADFTITLYNGNGGGYYEPIITLDQYTVGTVERLVKLVNEPAITTVSSASKSVSGRYPEDI